MTVEADADRTALLADFAQTITRTLGGSFSGAVAETDGFTLDSGTDSDGALQVLALTTDVIAAALVEHDTVIINAVTYTVDKIDSLADGLDVIYLGVT